MRKFAVMITVGERNPIVGEETGILAQARRRFKYERSIGDGRIVDIIENPSGIVIYSTDPKRIQRQNANTKSQ